MLAFAPFELSTLLIGLAGGLAIFLYGIEKMTAALKLIAGDRMRSLLARMTTNRFKAVFAGAFITATIQSSSVTTVLVVGFISAGLMTLTQSIGVIMGASIGTTITAQIVAFKVTKYALLLVAVGFATSFAAKKQRAQQTGHLMLGLGLIFFGMQVMKEAMSPLQSYEPFLQTMRTLDNPLLAVLFSALFTGLVQSSSATTGVIIALASQGFVSLEAGIPLIFGANIGTCVTALLAGIGKPREAVRASLVHVLFNTAGVLVWIGLIPQLTEFVLWMSPTAEGLTGAAQLKAESPRQIANAHTVFNVANTLLFLGFTPWIARLVEFLLPDRKAADRRPRDERMLEDLLLQTPALALDVVRMELGQLGKAALAMVTAARTPVLTGTPDDLDKLHAMDEEVDQVHAALVSYLARLSRENLSTEQSQRLSSYMAAANYFESIGDMIETNLVDAGKRRIAIGLTISDATQRVYEQLHDKVQWSVTHAADAVSASDEGAANHVIDAKAEIGQLADDLDSHLAKRLTADEPQRLEAFRLESELVEALRRIYYFAKRAAKTVLEDAAATNSRLPSERAPSN